MSDTKVPFKGFAVRSTAEEVGSFWAAVEAARKANRERKSSNEPVVSK